MRNEAIEKIDQLRERFETELANLAEINHGLIAWFERGRHLQKQMLHVAEVVHKYQGEFAELAKELIDRGEADPADWWKQ